MKWKPCKNHFQPGKQFCTILSTFRERKERRISQVHFSFDCFRHLVDQEMEKGKLLFIFWFWIKIDAHLLLLKISTRVACVSNIPKDIAKEFARVTNFLALEYPR